MKKENPNIKVIMSIIITVMIVLFVCTIYGVIYIASQESDFAFIFGYTTYINQEENMLPDYKMNDFLVIKTDSFYPTNTVILYNYKGTYRLGKINRISSGDRYVKDSTDLAETIVEDKDIVGKVNSNYGKIGAVIKFLTTIPAMVTIVLVVLIYFALSREQ